MGTGRNYERKGDPFTLSVRRGEGPPTVIRWHQRATGRDYFTRVPVHQCHALRVPMLAQGVRDHARRLSERKGEQVNAQALAELMAFDWAPLGATIKVRGAGEPPAVGEVRLTLETSRTGPAGAGVRYWITCPRCSRRCGVVYASPWSGLGTKPAQLVTGCRTCLGLTDESRQTHKTLAWVGAVDGSRTFTSDRTGRYRARSTMTQMRAHDVFLASVSRLFKSLGVPVPGTETPFEEG